MSLKVLTQDQVDQFIKCGYTKVEQAYPEQLALAAQDYLWSKVEALGFKRHDKSTWTQPMVQLKESYLTPTFEACLTPRLCDAVEDLVGVGRWRDNGDRSIPWGWWPVNFHRGADKPWDVPKEGWHWDGIQFKHTVNAPDQGLLLLCMFSETRPHSGGTLVVDGSHQVVARFLNRHPEGIDVKDAIQQVIAEHPWLRELTGASPVEQDRIEYFMRETTIDADGTPLRVTETTANPGDIYLCHPFLIHSSSQNHSGQARFMCNRITPLKERMNLNRSDGQYSPVELSIRNALGQAAIRA